MMVDRMADGFSFEKCATDSKTRARAGRVGTAHGSFDTPAFMPVGTQGTVKALTQEMLEGAGAGILLGNTYHLYLRPGHLVINRLGGLHRFIVLGPRDPYRQRRVPGLQPRPAQAD